MNERDADGRTPLIHAAIDNKLPAAILLLDFGATADSQDKLGNTALHYAAQDQHQEMASLLIARGANVEIEDAYGNTPLGRAVFNSRGRGELICVLLKAGADKNHRNASGMTPFELAKSIGNYGLLPYFT